MEIVPIQAVPSQTTSYIDPDGNQWDITIKAVAVELDDNNNPIAEQIAFSFTRNATVLIQGICAVSGYRIIPYDYLENGNFVLVTRAQQIPDYTQFGISQQLVFLTEAEIQSFRQPLSSLALITAADFDPNGALPLRFAPKGYTLA